MEFWKSLVIRKEIRKPSGKFLRVWAKNQWGLKFVEKLWNLHIEISMENWLFTHLLSHLPWPLWFYTAQENNTIFYNNFFGFGGGGRSFPPPAGAPEWYNWYLCRNKFGRPKIWNFIVITQWLLNKYNLKWKCWILLDLGFKDARDLSTISNYSKMN